MNQDGLRHGVLDLVNELAPMLGGRPEVALEGPIDNAVPQHLSATTSWPCSARR